MAAAGRPATAPLLLTAADEPLGRDSHSHFFKLAAQAASLPDGATIYAIRHSRFC